MLLATAVCFKSVFISGAAVVLLCNALQWCCDQKLPAVISDSSFVVFYDEYIQRSRRLIENHFVPVGFFSCVFTTVSKRLVLKHGGGVAE